MSLTNCNCMKIYGTNSKRLFIGSIYFDELSVFCNHQPHTRSKPIDGVIDYRLGQCFPLLKNGFFQFYGVFKSSSWIFLDLTDKPCSLNWKLRLLASRVNINCTFQRGHLPLWSLVFQNYYHLKKVLLAFRHCYVTMSIERPIIKKSYVTCKKTFERTLWKRLQSSMFKWTSFYYFLEFHCKILNSYVIYRCKKMVKILNCYLYAKKSYGTLSKGASFFGQPCILSFKRVLYLTKNKKEARFEKTK